MTVQNKKYTRQARTGLKGEATFAALVSDDCLAHRVVAPMDLGIDFFCEWVFEDRPSGVLFAVQVKTSSSAKPKAVKKESRLNGLDKYEIHNGHLKINEKTFNYWKGLGIPVYLFVMVENSSKGGGAPFNCYYRRFTPDLTTDCLFKDVECSNGFYHVNKGGRFIAFLDPEKRTQGFARDLFIDYVRCCYRKGAILIPDASILGLQQFQFPGDAIFGDLFKDYRPKIVKTYQVLKAFIECSHG